MRALVVDDSLPVRGIIAKIMRSLNFDTSEVCNGSEAITLLEQGEKFDVITVNWQMPVMDGLDFVTAVRRDRRFHRLPLVMISSESDSAQVQRALKAGVNQYIVKPCTARSLAAKLTAMGLITPTDTEDSPQFRSLPKIVTPPRRKMAARSSPSNLRVLVVDDSAIVRRVVSRMLDEAENIETIGAACDGVEAMEMITLLRPDVVLLDFDMPRMNGLDVLRQMRARRQQAPVLMFSSRTEQGAKIATEALMLGAKDFVFKPGGSHMSDLEAGQRAITEEVIPLLWSLTRQRTAAVPTKPKAGPTKRKAEPSHGSHRIDLVVVGASTGGPAALATMFADPSLKEHLLAPMVIAQHMPSLFTKHLAQRLALDSGLDIAEAHEGEVLRPGMIRIAPGGRHVRVRRAAGIRTILDDGPPVNSCRPSADVLFQSAAEAIGGNLLAVVLTGMGHDGREGSRAVKQQDGRVIAQDESSCVVWGMPGSVVKEGLADVVLGIDKISPHIAQELSTRRDQTDSE